MTIGLLAKENKASNTIPPLRSHGVRIEKAEILWQQYTSVYTKDSTTNDYSVELCKCTGWRTGENSARQSSCLQWITPKDPEIYGTIDDKTIKSIVQKVPR